MVCGASTFAGGSARLAWAAIVAGALLAIRAPAQPVRGDVVAVGFPAAGAAGFVGRDGQWLPVLASLSATGDEPVQCRVLCERTDLDGDRVSFVAAPPPINPAPAVRRVWCYVSSNDVADGMTLLVAAEDGQPLARLAAPPYERLSSDARLVLDLSQPPLALLDVLVTPGGAAETPLATRRFYFDIVLARMSPDDLPDRWFGLEAANVVVWDRPAPDALAPAQLEALVQWVRAGGHLVLGLGEAWSRVRDGALAELIPLASAGPPMQVERLPEFLRRFSTGDRDRFPAPIPIPRVRQTRGWRVFTDQTGTDPPIPLIVLDAVGSGRVTVVAASLRDLSSVPLRGEPLLPLQTALLDLHRPLPGFQAALAGQLFSSPAPTPLYAGVVRPIEMQQLGDVMLLLAFAFVLVYVAVTTLASWMWLSRRRLTHLSWTVFAAMSVLASAVSLAGVQGSRGCQEVHGVSFVDLASGSSEARAAVLFGYRSAARQRDDLSLPGDGEHAPNYLRGLSSCVLRADQTYATPARYAAAPARAQLADVLMRATLKQFEGRWHGRLAGTITAQLTADRESGRITRESWIHNDLPVEVAGGYVLYIDPRLNDEFGDVPLRLAGARSAYRPEYRGSGEVPAAVNVLAVEFGAIAPRGRVAQLGREQYQALDAELAGWLAAEAPDPARRPEPRTLWERQTGEWARSLTALAPLAGRFDVTLAAALLASTRDLYVHNNPAAAKPFESMGVAISGEGLIDLDVSDWLLRGQAMLLLWSLEPGPANLHRYGEPMRTRRGFTLYRVRVPLAYTGRPATAPPPASPDVERGR